MADSIVPLQGGQVIIYTPENPKQAIRELADAIEELARKVQMLENILFMNRAVAPDKPRAPILLYANGTNWNPGSGEGYYELRTDGQWYKL